MSVSRENTKLCYYATTNNNDFMSKPIAPPETKVGSFEISCASFNLVMKEQFVGSFNEDGAFSFA